MPAASRDTPRGRPICQAYDVTIFELGDRLVAIRATGAHPELAVTDAAGAFHWAP